VEIHGPQGSRDGDVEVRVIQEERRSLAAQLEAQAFHRTGSELHDPAAYGGGAGECHPVDPGIRHQGLAGHVAGPRHHVEDALRQARLLCDGCQLERGDGGVRGRLEDHRVAGRQGRGGLPDGHDEREVPGDDPGAYTERLALDELPCRGGEVGAGYRLGVFEATGFLGKILPVIDAERDREQVGHAQRVAGILGLQLAEFGLPLLEEPRHPDQDRRALLRGHCRPGAFVGGSPRRRDRSFHVLSARPRYAGDHRAVGGIAGLEGLPGEGVDELTVDEELVLPHGQARIPPRRIQ
jgi:hypothetical protein